MTATAPTAPSKPRPRPKHAYPRPPLVHDHRQLFREPAYADGQPYAVDDEDDDI
jgi:hypothetical protein